jgi:hypothetical protein
VPKSLLRVFVLALSLGTCLADEVTLPKNAVMRSDRSLVSIKAGTVVEVVERGDQTITIRYKGQTGTIPLASLSAPAAPTPTPAKPAPQAVKTPAPAQKSIVVDQPQSFYGNIVKKAETSVAKHDENLVKPANGAADDASSK